MGPLAFIREHGITRVQTVGSVWDSQLKSDHITRITSKGFDINTVQKKRRQRNRWRRENTKRGRRRRIIYLSRVSLACPSVRSFVRSFRFGYGYALRADISGKPRSHFQFNLLKARQKVIRYFTSAVDRDEIARASSRSDSSLNGARQWVCGSTWMTYEPITPWWYGGGPDYIDARLSIGSDRQRFSWQSLEKLICFRLYR